MNILYINNVGNTAAVLTKYLKQLPEHPNIVILNEYERQFFMYDMPEIIYKYNPVQFRYGIEWADVIHVHFKMAELIRVLCTTRKRKPIIMSFGGNDIRRKWHNFADALKPVSLVTVKTHDLLDGCPKGVRLMPIPIDREHWQRQQPYNAGTALRIYREHTLFTKDIAVKFAQQNNLKLTQYHRSGHTVKDISVFPRYLEQFEYYIDLKTAGEVKIPALSGTALQQLALGGKVYHWGKVLTEFPPENDAKHLAQQWFNIYQKLLNGE